LDSVARLNNQSKLNGRGEENRGNNERRKERKIEVITRGTMRRERSGK
jgi:hypothetical protein